MTYSGWNELIDGVIKLCSPTTYQEFAQKAGEDLEGVGLASLYQATPHLLLTAGMFHEVMTMSGADLSVIAAGLERLWEVAINDRDTSALATGHDEDEDEQLVGELENLRDGADGMLAIFEAYVAGNGSPDDNANSLIQQVALLTSSNLPKARRLFGQAGAAILRGASYWHFWHLEIDTRPGSGWARGLFGLLTFIELENFYPLAPLAEQRPKFSEAKAAQPAPPADEDLNAPLEAPLSPAEQRLMKILLCGSDKLSDQQIASVSFTSEIVSRLKFMVQSEDYAYEDSEGKGYAPIHAAKLLGQSGSLEAVDPLLLALYTSDPEDILYSTAVFALQELGSLALQPVLDSMQYSTDPDFRLSLAEVLSHVGQGNEQAFRTLEAYYHETTWDDDRVMAVADLAELGDPRALPLLRQALNDRDINSMGINETVNALEDLDPNHNPEELKRLETKARQRYDSRLVRFDKNGQAFCRDCGSLMEKGPFGEWQHVEPEPAPGRASRPALPVFDPFPPPVDPRYKTVGRNEPCPCGSGKKFKHCHGSGKEMVN